MNNSEKNIENQPRAVQLEIVKRSIERHKYAASLADMIKRVDSEPKLKMIYSGIKEQSVGVVVGPSKSAKTMYCEGLGMAIAAGADNYLGLPINMGNKIVHFISFEEHYTYRTERNAKQIKALVAQYGEAWLENFIVANEDIPRYIITKEHWQELADLILSVEPGIVFLDSLTHMYQGAIEESKVSVELMKNLRWLSEETGATIVAIHHTHKMYGQRLSIDTIAGSRVIAQECDFMIGLNRTVDGKKYIKDVAFRYLPSNDETVRTFEIDDNCCLNITGETDENGLLSAPDGRKDTTNSDKIYQFMTEATEAGTKTIPFSEIEGRFGSEMSTVTMYANLNKLIETKAITKPGKNEYGLAA